MKSKIGKLTKRLFLIVLSVVMLLGSFITVNAYELAGEPVGHEFYQYNLVVGNDPEKVATTGTAFYLFISSDKPLRITVNAAKSVFVYALNGTNYKVFSSKDLINWKYSKTTVAEGKTLVGSSSQKSPCIFDVSADYPVRDYSSGAILKEADLVFPVPERPLVAVARTTTPEIMKTIAGLLPLLIPCLIGLVALWKSWHFLLSQLQRA